MALNLKNSEVEELACEVAILARESKTEAIRKALIERRDRLKAHGGKLRGGKDLREYFVQNVWPMIPVEVLGKTISREEEDQILGYSPEGY